VRATPSDDLTALAEPFHPATTGRWTVLWRVIRPRRGLLAVAVLLGFVASAMELAIPLATQRILDSLGVAAALLQPVSILFALLVVAAVFNWWQWVLVGRLAEGIVYDARESMLRRFVRARLLPLLRFPTGELVTRVTSDSVLLREAASSSAIGLINGSVAIVGALVLMAVLDPVLLAVTLGALVIVGAGTAMLMPAIAGMHERAQAALGDLGSELEGTLRAIKTVKASNTEAEHLSSLLTKAGSSRHHGVRAVQREATVWTVANGGIQAAIIAVLAVGAWRVSLGELSVSALVAFLLYAFGLMGPVSEFTSHLTTLQAGIAAAGRIQQLEAIDLESDGSRSGVPSPVPDTPILELRDVTVSYDSNDRRALDGFSLIVPTVGHVALVGPSGAGKTSVLSLILRFVEPDGGELFVNSTPYSELTPAEVRGNVAYVQQEAPLVPGTLRRNLTFGHAGATDQQLLDVLRRLRLGGLVERLPGGLDAPIGDQTVSGGERQRIAVARALLGRPRLLLLDEATAQVDALSEAVIHEAIREQAGRGAVVTIAHRLSTVVDADRIILMDEGRTAGEGTHTELMDRNGLYRQMVETLSLP
jgi:ABC-type multidrug transport system fused ATPase/permease subunit